MVRWLHQLLLKLPPEFAHHVGIFVLRLYQKLTSRVPVAFLRQSFVVRDCLIKFPNPVGLAAGFDKNAECFAALSRLGFGFIEVGTVTPLPQEGNPKPRLWRVRPEGLINQMGFNNCGIERFKRNLQKYRRQCSVPIFANIGKNKMTPNESALEDYRLLFQELSSEVDGFVVNISSPNTIGLRDLQSVEFLEKIETLNVNKPIWVKLAPDLSPATFVELIEKIKNSVFTGVVLSNTSRAIALNEYQKAEGGYSGEKLFSLTLESVSRAREILKDRKSIIAVGGINSVEKARQIRQAGADLLEVYTSFVYHGPSLIRQLAQQ